MIGKLKGFHSFWKLILLKRNWAFLFGPESALIDDLNFKIEIIENQMDLRVESWMEQIHNYRNEYQVELNKAKDELVK